MSGFPVRQRPPKLDEAGLRTFLATQPDVVAAYLFGSLAQGRAAPQSDVDIAVLLVDRFNSDDDTTAITRGLRRLELIGELERYVDRGRDVDVVILNNASLVLQHQVLVHGRRLYERERNARVEFEVMAGKIYADLKPMRDYFTQALLDEIREGGLGERRRRRARAARLSAL